MKRALLLRSVLGGLGIIVALSAGCGGGNSTAEETVSRAVTTTGQYKMLSFSGSARSLYYRGEVLEVMLTVTNNERRSINFEYGRCQPYKCEVKDAGGAVVATFGQWDAPCNDTDEDKGGSLAPGESRTFPMTWHFGELAPWELALPIALKPHPLPVGRYTVQPVFDIGALDDEYLVGPGKPTPKPLLGPESITFTLREPANKPSE